MCVSVAAREGGPENITDRPVGTGAGTGAGTGTGTGRDSVIDSPVLFLYCMCII